MALPEAGDPNCPAKLRPVCPEGREKWLRTRLEKEAAVKMLLILKLVEKLGVSWSDLHF